MLLIMSSVFKKIDNKQSGSAFPQWGHLQRRPFFEIPAVQKKAAENDQESEEASLVDTHDLLDAYDPPDPISEFEYNGFTIRLKRDPIKSKVNGKPIYIVLAVKKYIFDKPKAGKKSYTEYHRAYIALNKDLDYGSERWGDDSSWQQKVYERMLVPHEEEHFRFLKEYSDTNKKIKKPEGGDPLGAFNVNDIIGELLKRKNEIKETIKIPALAGVLPEYLVFEFLDSKLPTSFVYWTGVLESETGGLENRNENHVWFYKINSYEFKDYYLTAKAPHEGIIKEIIGSKTPYRKSDEGIGRDTYEGFFIDQSKVRVVEGNSETKMPLREAFGKKGGEQNNKNLYWVGRYTSPPTELRVNYKTDKFKITDDHIVEDFDFNEFDKDVGLVLKYLNAYSDTVKIKIFGHTDTVGSSASNIELSKKRADAFASYLKDPKWKELSLTEEEAERQIEVVEGKGEEKARKAGSPDNEDNPDYRLIEVEYTR